MERSTGEQLQSSQSVHEQKPRKGQTAAVVPQSTTFADVRTKLCWRSNRRGFVIKPVGVHSSLIHHLHLISLPQQVNPAISSLLPPSQVPSQAAAGTEQRGRRGEEEGRRGEEEEKDVHTLTYVLSIEISLTVTVLCREGSREKRG